VAGLCLSLAACGGAALRWEPDAYTVRAGDSLYAIAWRYRLDYRDLSRWNRLDNPDLIYPGQRLRLSGPARAPAGKQQTGARRAPPPPERIGTPAERAPSAPPPAAAEAPPAAPAPGWHWPADGQLVAAFGAGAGAGKGIDIGGRPGDAVLAAADGRVVYSGSGLIGYGQLIIIKHNNTYLSAYGHNRALLVTEGDAVERGQRIAEMGIGPDRKPLLHFEIRLNGKPVDPLRQLPAR
jgi:lipoprotein NlpD